MAYGIDTDGEFRLAGALAQRAVEDVRINEHVRPCYSHRSSSGRELEYASIKLYKLDDAQLDALADHARACHDKRLGRCIDAAKAFNGKVPFFDAVEAMLVRVLRHRLNGQTNAWLYRRAQDGHVYPVLITGWQRKEPSSRDRDEKPTISLRAVSSRAAEDRESYYGWRGEHLSGGVTLYPADVTHKTIEQALNDSGLFFETPELVAAYTMQHVHFDATCAGKFGEQFRLDRRDDSAPGAKVILDTANSKIPALRTKRESTAFRMDTDGEWGNADLVPVHPFVRVFRLDTHDFMEVNCIRLSPYVYNPGLANKLILPESHMDILDVLTTGTSAYLSDIIEGKSSGNIILCKGSPGVGKTLTAEVYAEIVKRPLYNLHSGELGTGPDTVEKNIRVVFDRVKRWNCVLLLDEADVFVAQRGANLVQNAIVAVFLRVLEYNDALMFMTTNRSDNIDDAIISRCAAIIEYKAPDRRDRAAIWTVMAENNGVELPEALVAQLIDTFPSASPRDIKHLMRLALRVQSHTGEALTDKLFRRVGAFRAVDIADAIPDAMAKPVPRERRRERHVM